MNTARKRLRLFYAAGPGDVLGTFTHWSLGRDDPSQVSMTYSGMFFDVVQRLDAEALAVAWQPGRRDRDTRGRITVINRPVRWADAGGIRWHLGQIAFGLGMLARAVRFRAAAAVISGGTHWFIAALFPLFGIKLITSLHTLFWGKYENRGRVARTVAALNRTCFARAAATNLCASEEIVEQINEMTRAGARPTVCFVPTYRREVFDAIQPPDHTAAPFRVLYAGRVEPEKGIDDLVDIAARLEADAPDRFAFDVCGTGSALDRARAGAPSNVAFHGHADRPTMQQMFSRSHAVIVPTRRDCPEGFNQVVVESILAGRPVITSPVCPALSLVEPAAEVVEPDNTDRYLEAIVRLADDAAHYESRRAACAQLAERFYDESAGWAAALTDALHTLGLTEQTHAPLATSTT